MTPITLHHPEEQEPIMPIRRMVLDVDKAVERPDLTTLARVVETVHGVTAVNITVTEIDIETVGTEMTVVGDDIDADQLFRTIEKVGAVVHSVDEVVAGSHIVDHVPRAR